MEIEKNKGFFPKGKKKNRIFLVKKISNCVANLIVRKFEFKEKTGRVKNDLLKGKPKKKKNLVLSKKNQELFFFLTEKFLKVLGEESSNRSLSNGRTLVNQMDILKCWSLKKFFEGAEEIFKYHQKIQKIFLTDRLLISWKIGKPKR